MTEAPGILIYLPCMQIVKLIMMSTVHLKFFSFVILLVKNVEKGTIGQHLWVDNNL